MSYPPPIYPAIVSFDVPPLSPQDTLHFDCNIQSDESDKSGLGTCNGTNAGCVGALQSTNIRASSVHLTSLDAVAIQTWVKFYDVQDPKNYSDAGLTSDTDVTAIEVSESDIVPTEILTAPRPSSCQDSPDALSQGFIDAVDVILPSLATTTGNNGISFQCLDVAVSSSREGTQSLDLNTGRVEKTSLANVANVESLSSLSTGSIDIRVPGEGYPSALGATTLGCNSCNDASNHADTSDAHWGIIEATPDPALETQATSVVSVPVVTSKVDSSIKTQVAPIRLSISLDDAQDGFNTSLGSASSIDDTNLRFFEETLYIMSPRLVSCSHDAELISRRTSAAIADESSRANVSTPLDESLDLQMLHANAYVDLEPSTLANELDSHISTAEFFSEHSDGCTMTQSLTAPPPIALVAPLHHISTVSVPTLDVNKPAGIQTIAHTINAASFPGATLSEGIDQEFQILGPGSGEEDEDLRSLALSQQLSSSPMPSSSPPQIFSSPPKWEELPTPPSSSPLLGPSVKESMDHQKNLTAVSDIDVDMDLQTNIQIGKSRESTDLEKAMTLNGPESDSPAKRMVKRAVLEAAWLSPPRPPNPKRQTIVSQKKQYRKLATAFRSPLIADGSPLLRKDGVYCTGVKPDPVKRADLAVTGEEIDSPASEQGSKGYTANAAKSFKSPLAPPLGNVPAALATSVTPAGSIHSTSTMQALMTQVQKLKQAIKIKNEGEGHDIKLEELVNKWTRIGREVAWEVWAYVKDDENTASDTWGDSVRGKKRGVDDTWGDDSRNAKRGKCDSWGWDHGGEEVNPPSTENLMGEDKEEDLIPTVTHSLGTMLRFMGIAPETFGWDEGEGDFAGGV